MGSIQLVLGYWGSTEQGQAKGRSELRRGDQIDGGDASWPRNLGAASRVFDAVLRWLLVQMERPKPRLLRGAFVDRKEWPERLDPMVNSGNLGFFG